MSSSLPPLSTQGSWKLTLQTQCLTCILHYLDDYPHSWLCQIPTKQRKALLMSSPPLDICKLESTEVASGIDLNEVWRVTCLLYDETDNIRITGNPKFDSRYLDFKSNENEDEDAEDEDAIQAKVRLHIPKSFFTSTRQADVADKKVKGDWKAHFFIRTVQLLLHSFDPSKVPDTLLRHSNVCNSLNDSETECDCWGEGLDPNHRAVLLRLMTVPPQSNISKASSDSVHRFNHFQEVSGDVRQEKMLVPFRYTQYFQDDFQISAIDLLSLVVSTCHFRPKLLPVRCEFFFYTDIYRTYLENPEKWAGSMAGIFVDFLSEIECLEFFWVGGLRDRDMELDLEHLTNPVSLMPKLFLEAVFANPSPKIDTLEINMFKFMRYYMPKADACLRMIAPYFSFLNNEGEPEIAYDGLKRIHISGVLDEEASDGVLSSLLASQKALEGVRLSLKARRLDETRSTLATISNKAELDYLIINMWQVPNHTMDEFWDVFSNFVDSSSNCALSLSSLDHSVILVPPSSDISHCRVLRLYTFNNPTYGVGHLFKWLESKETELIPTSMVFKTAIVGTIRQSILPYLSICKVVEFDSKVPANFSAEFLSKIASNENLEVLILNNFKVPIDKFCQALDSLFARNTVFQKLSFCSNKLNKASQEDLELFFKTVLSYPQLDQLVLDIRNNNLKQADMEVMKNAWRSIAQGRSKGSVIQGRIKEVIVDKELRDCEALSFLVA